MRKTKKWKKLMLKASQDLLDYYEGKNDLFKTDECPYCVIVEEIYDDGTCKKCPWIVLEEKYCTHFAFERGLIEDVSSHRRIRNDIWIQHRIPMLKKWIKELSK